LIIAKNKWEKFSLSVEVIWEKRVNRFHFLIKSDFTNFYLKIYNFLRNLLVFAILLMILKLGIGIASNFFVILFCNNTYLRLKILKGGRI